MAVRPGARPVGRVRSVIAGMSNRAARPGSSLHGVLAAGSVGFGPAAACPASAGLAGFCGVEGGMNRCVLTRQVG